MLRTKKLATVRCDALFATYKFSGKFDFKTQIIPTGINQSLVIPKQTIFKFKLMLNYLEFN